MSESQNPPQPNAALTRLDARTPGADETVKSPTTSAGTVSSNGESAGPLDQ